jgi:hypothetical protein
MERGGALGAGAPIDTASQRRRALLAESGDTDHANTAALATPVTAVRETRQTSAASHINFLRMLFSLCC